MLEEERESKKKQERFPKSTYILINNTLSE